MDSWQTEVTKKIRDFVDDCSPSTFRIEGEEVKLAINSSEAYVLLNMIEKWANLSQREPK